MYAVFPFYNFMQPFRYYWTIGGFFVAFQHRWSIYQSKGRRKVSRSRYGWTLSHASDARYSASNCQKRTYNYILYDYNSLHNGRIGIIPWPMRSTRVDASNDMFIWCICVSKKIFSKNFFSQILPFFPRVPPLGQKSKKNFFGLFSYFVLFWCVYTCRMHWSRNNPNPTIMNRVMVERMKL